MKKFLSVALLGATLLLPTIAGAEEYKVQKGDTLSEIAYDRDLKLDDLRKANNQYSDLILIGQTLNLPSGATQPVNKVRQANTNVSQQSTTAGESRLLAQLVSAEALSESYNGKVAVAKVVLNRVANDSYPNSITGVIYQRGQFSPVSNGSINRTPDNDSVRAVNEALAQGGNPNGALYFYNPSIASNSWLNGLQTVQVLGNHVFKK